MRSRIQKHCQYCGSIFAAYHGRWSIHCPKLQCVLAHRRDAYQKNHARHIEIRKKYREENRLRINAESLAWYHKHSEAYKYTPEMYSRRKDRYRIERQKRRARLLGAPGSFTPKQWQHVVNIFENRCVSCRKERPLAADHKVPLSRGGHNSIDNIQPLCRACNTSKHTRTMFAASLLSDRVVYLVEQRQIVMNRLQVFHA